MKQSVRILQLSDPGEREKLAPKIRKILYATDLRDKAKASGLRVCPHPREGGGRDNPLCLTLHS